MNGIELQKATFLLESFVNDLEQVTAMRPVNKGMFVYFIRSKMGGAPTPNGTMGFDPQPNLYPLGPRIAGIATTPTLRLPASRARRAGRRLGGRQQRGAHGREEQHEDLLALHRLTQHQPSQSRGQQRVQPTPKPEAPGDLEWLSRFYFDPSESVLPHGV